MNGVGNIDLATVADAYAVPLFICVALVLAIVACYSYKLLRLTFLCTFTVVLGVVGATVADMFIPAVAGIEISGAVGLVCGIIGAVIGKKCFKLCAFVFGAAEAYVAANSVVLMFPDIELFQNPIAVLIISIVCALIIGILSIFIYKALWIIVASVGSMVLSGAAVGYALTEGAAFVLDSATNSLVATYPAENPIFILAGMAIGLIVGIVVAVNQFRNSYDY
jgi:hypothetical protein